MVLCIGHIIGEYFLTNKYIVKKKDKKKIFCYCLAYIIPFIIIGMLFYIYGYNIGKICLECICIHFIIEVIKRWIENYDIRTNKLPINVTNVIYVCSLIFHILSFFLIIWKSSILVYYFPEYIIKPIPYLLYFLCIAKCRAVFISGSPAFSLSLSNIIEIHYLIYYDSNDVIRPLR